MEGSTDTINSLYYMYFPSRIPVSLNRYRQEPPPPCKVTHVPTPFLKRPLTPVKINIDGVDFSWIESKSTWIR